MTSLALGMPVAAKKVMADDADSPSVSLSTYGQHVVLGNGQTVTVVGGAGNIAVAMGANLPIGGGNGSFSLLNDKGGVLSATAGANDNASAYGQRVVLGSGQANSHNNTVVLSNLGSIKAKATYVSGINAAGNSGMYVGIQGENNQITMSNDGNITVDGYDGASYMNPNLGSNVDVIGMQASTETGNANSLEQNKNTVFLHNNGGGRIGIKTAGSGSDAFGLYAFSRGAVIDATLRNDGVVTAEIGGLDGFDSSRIYNGANGMRFGANGSKGEARLENNGTINALARIKPDGQGRLIGENQVSHGMLVLQSGDTSSGASVGRINATFINGIKGKINVLTEGKNGLASGISSFSTGGGVWNTIINEGQIDVAVADAVQNNYGGGKLFEGGQAYGMYLSLGKDKASGIANKALIVNTGIINVRGETAHQLYVTRGVSAAGAGIANVALWNLAPVAGAADNQKIFKVDNDATLNFGDDKGNGAKLILRTSDAGDNGHDGADVTDLIANKGGTVTGVIDTVYSGGNVNGDNAHLYQATLEGYDNYANQSVFIDRAWQFNAADGSKSAVNCATVSCALYSSTQGLGLDNAGTLDVAVTDAVGAGMYANLRTMAGIDNKTVSLLNSGTVNATADGSNGKAYGLFVRLQDGQQSADVTNTGIINVRGATAHQLYVMGEPGVGGGTANLKYWNLSPVAATSVDQRIFAVANKATLNFGDDKGNGAKLILRTSDAGDNGHDGADVTDLIANKGGTVTGVIDTVYSGGNVNGDNAHLYQATLEGYDNYANQSVFIDRAWQFNAADDSKSAVNCATVSCALYSSTQGLGLDNAGTLDVAVTDAVGAGMYANLRTMAGIDNKTVSLLNSGTVNATADGSNGKAYGLFVRLQDDKQSADITNTGIINVRGATAHQLYVMGEPGVGGGTANLKRWNLELYDRTSGNQSVFAVADGATLNFDATHMMLRPGDVGKGYENNKHFNVEDMVYNYGNGSQVTGKIGSVSTPLPMLTAAYGRVDEKGPDQWNNQWVSLNVDAEESDGPTVNAGVVDSMQSQVDRVGNLLVGGGGGGGIGLGDGDLTSVQLKIYYGNQQRRGTGASVTDSTGAVAYADYEIGEGHTLGWHGGAEYAHLRAKSKTLNINSLSAIVGGQGRYNFSDTTYLRGQVSGILSNNNNHFNAFDGSTSKVSTINFGLYGAVYAGYDYKPDENNTITPELGISALWSHTPSMDVKYDKSPDLNHSYAAQNYSAVYANAGIRWTGGLDINGTLLKPTVMAGVRQTLGDGKVKSAMSFNGNHFDTSITRDRTMGIVDVGVSTTVSVGLDVGLNYRGEYGSTTTNHVGYLNGTIRF